MSGSIFGSAIRVSTFGESHGTAIGVVIDGVPAGFELDMERLNTFVRRRRPGQSKITTQRKESDNFEILSGVFENKTLGTPLAAILKNEDQRSADYSHIQKSFRPSHADYTYQVKYGHRDYRGGGRSSARETAARVFAGGICHQILAHFGIEVRAGVVQIGEIKSSEWDWSSVEQNLVRCPDPRAAKEMQKYIEKIQQEGDTCGGVIRGEILNCPAGLGEPVFDRFEADLAKAMLSINATKGFEIGSGFKGATWLGSQHNDEFVLDSSGGLTTKTNHSGGVQGGITNGMPVTFQVAFKPVATIMKDQSSVDESGKSVQIKGKGRHDPCVLPRAVPIVEAMASIVTFDHFLRSQCNQISNLHRRSK